MNRTDLKLVGLLGALLGLAVITACTPKSTPRYVHESKREWKPKEFNEPVEAAQTRFEKLDVNQFSAKLNLNATEIEKQVVQPLMFFVLSPQYIDNPKYRTTKLEQIIGVFNSALLKVLLADAGSGISRETQWAYEELYERTIAAGCRDDLSRDCRNLSFFSADPRSSKIILNLARRHDTRIEELVKQSQSPQNCVTASRECRELVHERYRRLALAMTLRRSGLLDNELSFAYLKFARIYAVMVQAGFESGYLAETHASVFETIISRYRPDNINSPEFTAFVENFNPWTYSAKRNDIFRHGTKVMFDFATQCCLYTDANKIKLTGAVQRAIDEGQADADPAEPSFTQIVTALSTRNKGMANKASNVLENLGMSEEASRILRKDPTFFNEYFFIIDRLFRGHLESSEAMKILESSNLNRAQTELLKILKTYIRIHIVNLTVETNDFMNGIYNSKDVSSDSVFQEALLRSKDISGKWLKLQSRIDLLNRFIGAYFKRSAVISKEYIETDRMLQSVNRNVHYLSVYPNMIAMTYFLAKMKGTIKVRSWWGQQFEVAAESVVTSLFDGDVKEPWLRFGNDPVWLSREMLLYAFHYALKTQALETFTVNEKSPNESDRSKFFELTIGKYLEGDLRDLDNAALVTDRDIFGSGEYAQVQQICRYELDDKASPRSAPRVDINLLNLKRYTYGGLGNNSSFDVLSKLFTGEIGTSLQQIRSNLVPKLTYVKSIIGILEDHMISAGEIKAKGESHPELDRIRRIVSDVEAKQRRILTTFFKHRGQFFECMKRIQQAELARSYRLYEEERSYLSQVHDIMTSTHAVKDPAQALAKEQEVNAKYFPESKARFDRVIDGSFRYSRFDLLMRMKERIEKDIFAQPTTKEREIYGADLARLTKPRSVQVFFPPGIEREDMVAKGEYTQLFYVEDKEDFIRQGLSLLNGKAGSYVEWRAQADSLKLFRAYLDDMINLYLLGEVTTNGFEYGKCATQGCLVSERITARELVDAYGDLLHLADMNRFDLEYSQIFGVDGVYRLESLTGLVIEDKTFKALPVFRNLMTEVYERAGMKLNEGSMLMSARTLADTLNNLGVILFDPGPQMRKTLQGIYGQTVNQILVRVDELYKTIDAIDQTPTDSWKSIGDFKFRVVDGGVVSDLRSAAGREGLSLADRQLLANFRVVKGEFVRFTDNFFETREAFGGAESAATAVGAKK